jgi:hypothetical protein
MTIFVTNKDGRSPVWDKAPRFAEPTRDRTQTMMVLQEDKSVRVQILANDDKAVVQCQIFGTAREPWSPVEIRTGSVWCGADIAARFRG